MVQNTVIRLTIAVYIIFIAAVSIMSAKKSKNITEFTVGKRNAGACLAMIVSSAACLAVTHITKGNAEDNKEFYTLTLAE